MRRRRRPGPLDLPMDRIMPIGDRLILAQTQMLIVADRTHRIDGNDYSQAADDWAQSGCLADRTALLGALYRTVIRR